MQQPSAGHRNPQSPYSRAANQKTGGAQAAHVPMIEGTDLLKDPAATEALLEDKWAGGAGFAFIDSILGSRTNAAVNKVLADFVRQKIREAVDDPATAELLCPEETLTMGAKRQILDTNYYETYNRERPTALLGPTRRLCQGLFCGEQAPTCGWWTSKPIRSAASPPTGSRPTAARATASTH